MKMKVINCIHILNIWIKLIYLLITTRVKPLPYYHISSRNCNENQVKLENLNFHTDPDCNKTDPEQNHIKSQLSQFKKGYRLVSCKMV